MFTVTALPMTHNHFVAEWRRMQDIEGELAPATRQAVKRVLESALEVEIQDLTGGPSWARGRNTAYRNGYYWRRWMTGVGEIPDLRVPRLRIPVTFRVLPRYQRRAPEVDALVREMFLAGVSTRRVHEVLERLVGEARCLSASTVSQLIKVLDTEVSRFHARALPDTYRYLLLDGVFLKTKSPLTSQRRCILVAYGITTTGQRELVDYQLAPQGESETAWSAFLTRLIARGLTGTALELIITDGHKGLANALALCWPTVEHQLCWAHKLRNVATALPRRLYPTCLREAKAIPHAPSAAAATAQLRTWAKRWRATAPKAVTCLERDWERLTPVFQQPKPLWQKLRTTNAIERVFREVRRRTRPMSCFQNPASVDRIIYAIFMRMNRQWQGKARWLITQDS